MLQSIKAVIFDCDGVLADSEVLSISGERLALAEMGLSYSPSEYVRRFVGMHDAMFFEALRKDYRAEFLAEPPDNFEDRVLAGRRARMHELAAVDGADRAMRAVTERGLAIAVASSSRAHHLSSKLERLALAQFASPHIYSADLVSHGKPAPDIFLYTAERLGLPPEGCLVLEDSENGVRAGVAAGMTVWGFLGGGHIYDGHGERLLKAGAHEICETFETFVSRLKR